MQRIDPRIGGFVAALALAGSSATVSSPATFEPTPISPELGLDVLDRSVSEAHLDRALLAAPHSVAALGTVDVYDVFPYVESRFFVVVSDPEWNRLVVTETGSGTLSAFDGSNTEIGALSSPHGLAVDRQGWLYLCDTDNDRLVVLEPRVEYDQITFVPHPPVAGLSRPFDVAVHDGGTPFDASDDRLYVVEAGANRVSRWDRTGDGFVATSRIGGLGTGPGRFAGPTAIAVTGSGVAPLIYVAEAHTERIVQLQDSDDGMRWLDSRPVGLGLVTGLDTDQWGNLYVTGPRSGSVHKLTGDLEPLATLDGLRAPKDFFIPFVRTEDHRTGRTGWSGHGTGVLIEEWGRGSGLRLFDLGLDVENLRATPENDGVTARFRLTDPGDVTIRLIDPSTGGTLAEHGAGTLPVGDATAHLSSRDLIESTPPGDYVIEVSARSHNQSSSGRSQIARSRTPVTLEHGFDGGVLAFGGVHPNPFVGSTEFRLTLPANVAGNVEVELFDPSGRRVRRLDVPATAGGLAVPWDGRDQSGDDPGSGVYLYRIRTGDWERSGKVVRLR